MLSPIYDPFFHEEKLGEALFERASSFFAWYEWVRKASDPPEAIHDLLAIMKIAESQTLTEEEEKKATSSIEALVDQLDGGQKTFGKIPDMIKGILDALTETNPKSRLVRNAMAIEMILREKSMSEEFFVLMEEAMKRVKTSMTPLVAKAISHQLHLFLESGQIEPDQKKLKDKLWMLMK